MSECPSLPGRPDHGLPADRVRAFNRSRSYVITEERRISFSFAEQRSGAFCL